MTMAAPQAPAKERPAISCYTCLFLFIIAMAIVTKSSLVKADDSPAPQTLVFYSHGIPLQSTLDRTVVAISPTGNFSDFGTIIVLANDLHAGPAKDSPWLGKLVGEKNILKDGSLYVSLVLVVCVQDYAGTIILQGSYDSTRTGVVAITGGTGHFVKASGYAEITVIDHKSVDKDVCLVYVNLGGITIGA